MSPTEDIFSSFIRKLELLGPLTIDERQSLLKISARVVFQEANQDIVREGDRPTHCVLVVSGWLARYKLSGAAKRQLFSFHTAGDLPDFDSISLLVMDHSICALTDAVIVLLPHRELLDVMRRFPVLNARIWREVLVESAVLREWIMGLSARRGNQRVAHLFCELYVKLESISLARDLHFPMPLTQQVLGEALGQSAVHVNRVLQELRGKKLINLSHGTLQILNWPELIKFADFDPTYLHLKQRPAV